MSFKLRFSILGLLLAALHPTAFATSPYLETIPATFFWQFNTTGVGIARTPLPVESTVPIDDPDTIKPVDRITTETGTPITYSAGNGNQAFFVTQLTRAVLERLAQASINPANTEACETEINFIKKYADNQWELTFVREPQTSAEGVMTTPYWLFLTHIDRVTGKSLISYDTGIRLVPKYSAGTKSETFASSQLTNATGSITTYFTLAFENMYATDPLYLIDVADRGGAVEGETYNTTGASWRIRYGSGYLTYSLRKTAGTSQVVAPTRMKATGVGSWEHKIFDDTDTATYAGTAPLSLKLGEVKYQRREFFPEFAP